MQEIVTILWHHLYCADRQLLSFDREQIRWVFNFFCDSSETLHINFLGLLATEMLYKCTLNTQSTQRLVTYATKIVQRKTKIAF